MKQAQFEVHEIFPLTYEHENGLGREVVKRALDKYKHLNVLPATFNSDGKGIIQGSNSFSKGMLYNAMLELTQDQSFFPINPLYSEIGLKNYLISQEQGKQDHQGILYAQDGKIILVTGSLDKPRETYEDLVFSVNYPSKGANPNLWEDIRKQIKSESKYRDNIDLSLPFVVTWPLDFEQHDKMEYGVRVILNKDGLTQIYNVPILNSEGNFDENDPGLLEIGFPSKLGSGKRTLSTIRDGGRRFVRYGGLGLSARDGGLVYSNDAGRVHFARKISSGNLEEKIREQYKRMFEQDRKVIKERVEQQYKKKLEELESINL